MAKRKITKTNERVVDGYTKIEENFVETFLKKDGETLGEAKDRLKNKK